MTEADIDVSPLVRLALDEDLGELGDLTCQAFVDPDHVSVGRIVSREDCVVSGTTLVEEVFRSLDPSLEFHTLCPDGAEVESGVTVFDVRGKTRFILEGERTALNFLQRLSGVATTTRSYLRQVAGTDVKLLDTRKTSPGWRRLEKKAVLDGGGHNHRMGLYDAVMIKDNHLVANPSVDIIEGQITRLRERHPEIPVIIEADNLDQLRSFLSIDGVDRILLDNMTNEELLEAVGIRNQICPDMELEASGGVNLKTISGIATTGVDYISVGALTHSVRAIDFGLDLELG